MTVIVEKSVCFNCGGQETCQRLKRLFPQKTIRDETNELHKKYVKGGLDSNYCLSKDDGKYRKRDVEVFEVVIIDCSMKQRYKEIK